MATTQRPPNPAGEPAPGSGSDRPGNRFHPANWLLLVPLVATLLPWFYNRIEPRLFGIPFFYWYQLAAIGIGVGCTLIVYRLTRSVR